MATIASSDASRSAATSPRPSEISEDDNIGQITTEGTPAEDEDEDKYGGEKEEPLDNPSKDIKGNLQRIFNHKDFKFTGTFYSSQSYPNAPNPGLTAKGFGLVGLPLVGSVARSLITKCEQAAFGKGERTIVDKDVRDTWEMDASKVTFMNPEWSKWVNSTVLPAVCEKLGVNIETSKPRAELYKLLVYEKGSHFLPHQDTAKSVGMFGTIVILLPSPFTGGALDLSHNGKHAVIDASSESSFSTHVAAWYTDVYHAVKPVQSGYRVVLSYNLIHSTAPSLKPVVNSNPLFQQLKHTMLSWKFWDDPMKLVYVMDHMYSAQELRAVTLKGKDAHLVSNLRGVAKELGFRLCLVNLELRQSGQADDCGQWDDYDPYEEYDSDDEDAVEQHRQAQQGLTIGQVEEQAWSFDDAVDLDGHPVELNEELEWSDEDEFFPHGLDATSPDEEEYEGYMGNSGGNLDLWYRRTALLIWPEQHDLDIVVEDVADYAEENLNQNDSEKATVKEKTMAETLITWCESHDDVEGVLEALCTAAVRWKDADLWVRACEAAQVDYDIDLLGWEKIVEDVGVFGFGALTEFLTSAIDHNRTDEPRFRLLYKLKKLAHETSDGVLLQWTKEQREVVLRSLRTASTQNILHYVSALDRRGRLYFQKTILPQLVALKTSSAFWQAFATTLREVKEKLRLNADEIDQLIRLLISRQISAGETFPVKSLPNRPDGRIADLGCWISTVKEGAALGDRTIKLYFQRMQESWDKMPVSKRQWVAQNFLPRAMDHLSKWATSCTPPRLPGDATLEPFWMLSLACYLEHIKGQHVQLVLALRWCGELEKLKDRLAPIVRKLATDSSSSLQEVVNQAHLLSLQPGADKALATSLKTLIHVSSLDLAANAPISRTMSHVNGTSTAQPDYTLSINLIYTVLRCNLMQSVEQTAEAEVPSPQLEEPVDFSKLHGQSGVAKWIQQEFEEAQEAEMIQSDFWNLYKNASVVHGIDSTLTATKLLKLVTTTFTNAYLKIVAGKNGEPSKYMIIGLRSRRKVTENQVQTPPTHPIVEEPKPFVEPFRIILERLLEFSMTAQYLSACVLPLIRACVAELRSLDISWPSQPLTRFACSAIYNMVKQVGPEPLVPLTNAELTSLGCGCVHCLDLRRFAANKERTLSIRAAESVRLHIERQLGVKAREWGFTYITIRVGSPHTLQITKPQTFGAQKAWKEGKQRALAAMATLGPVPTQATILGEKWPEVCNILKINQTVPAGSNVFPMGRDMVLPRGDLRIARALPGTSAPRINNGPVPVQGKPKRTFQQAFQGANASDPVAKRNRPIEIIELSD